MKILDWYIVKRLIVTFLFTILLFDAIACVIDYSQKVEDFVNNKAPFLSVLGYYGVFIPHITALLYHLFLFIAAIFFTSRLAYKSEIIAMLATSMSFNRLMRPYIIGSAFLAMVLMVSNHFLIPLADKYRINFENKYYHNKVTETGTYLHLQLSPGTMIYMWKYDYINNRGTSFTAENINGTHLTEKIFAESASYDSAKHYWLLHNVTIRTNDSLHETLHSMPELIRYYAFIPQDLLPLERIKETLTTPQLNAYIAKQELRGAENLSYFYVEKYRRTADPFAVIILTIIAACLASKKVRGGSGLHIAIGVLLGFVYVMLLQFSTTLAVKSGYSALVAVWVPNFIFGTVAAILWRRKVV